MRTDHELDVEWQGITLAGTLSLPDGDGVGPAPVVVLMQGSGSADRQCGGYFEPIAETFLRRGLATYAFDKPGCGRSTGDWRDHPLMARADQVVAVIEALRASTLVDPDRIGVWGQSQGGWMAQILAGRDLDLAFAIANSGPSIGVVEQNIYGVEHTMRDEGRPEAEIVEALAFLNRLHTAAAAGWDEATVEQELLAPVQDTPWYQAQYDEATPADWGFLRHLVEENYRPLEALGQVDCPFLAVYGGADLLVPAWRGAEETGRALQAGGTADATVVVFPGANHRIKEPGSDRFAAGYLTLLGQWAAARMVDRSS